MPAHHNSQRVVQEKTVTAPYLDLCRELSGRAGIRGAALSAAILAECGDGSGLKERYRDVLSKVTDRGVTFDPLLGRLAEGAAKRNDSELLEALIEYFPDAQRVGGECYSTAVFECLLHNNENGAELVLFGCLTPVGRARCLTTVLSLSETANDLRTSSLALNLAQYAADGLESCAERDNLLIARARLQLRHGLCADAEETLLDLGGLSPQRAALFGAAQAAETSGVLLSKRKHLNRFLDEVECEKDRDAADQACLHYLLAYLAEGGSPVHADFELLLERASEDGSRFRMHSAIAAAYLRAELPAECRAHLQKALAYFEWTPELDNSLNGAYPEGFERFFSLLEVDKRALYLLCAVEDGVEILDSVAGRREFFAILNTFVKGRSFEPEAGDLLQAASETMLKAGCPAEALAFAEVIDYCWPEKLSLLCKAAVYYHARGDVRRGAELLETAKELLPDQLQFALRREQDVAETCAAQSLAALGAAAAKCGTHEDAQKFFARAVSACAAADESEGPNAYLAVLAGLEAVLCD